MSKTVRLIVPRVIAVLLCTGLLLHVALRQVWAGGAVPTYPSRPMWELLVEQNRAALAEAPKDAEVLFWYGIGLANLGYIKDAATAFDKMLKADTDRSIARSLEAASLRTLARDPSDLTAGNASAFLSYAAGDYAVAAQRFATVVALDPDNPWARCYYAFSMGKAGKIDAAVSFLEDSVRRFPDNKHLHFLLGLGYYHKGALLKAVKEMAQSGNVVTQF